MRLRKSVVTTWDKFRTIIFDYNIDVSKAHVPSHSVTHALWPKPFGVTHWFTSLHRWLTNLYSRCSVPSTEEKSHSAHSNLYEHITISKRGPRIDFPSVMFISCASQENMKGVLPWTILFITDICIVLSLEPWQSRESIDSIVAMI